MMIGLDTNILLRAITRDDDVRSPLAIDFLSKLTPANKGVINSVVLAELAWSLRRGYKYERLEVIEIILTLLRSPSYVFTDRQSVNIAIARCQEKPMDFADALIGELNKNACCETTMTFDTGAAKSGAFTLLEA
jgi:predicted nucleic-acid-binding protein